MHHCTRVSFESTSGWFKVRPGADASATGLVGPVRSERTLMPRPLSSAGAAHWYLAVALFFFFGCRSLYESLLAWEGGGMREELAETEKELAGSKGSKTKAKQKSALLSSSVLAETFVITFLAEWGDRSQIATIGLHVVVLPFPGHLKPQMPS